jgi:ABC-2 type transport system ATP-binding protein
MERLPGYHPRPEVRDNPVDFPTPATAILLTMPEALLVEGVTKRFSGHTAVQDLTLHVPQGSIWGILGPNGAGKSTTLRMVMNIIGRDSGRILLDGVDPERDRRVLRRIGYLPEERGLYKKMKVLDVIEFFAALKGVPGSRGRTLGAEWLERMGLAEWRDARVDTLSKGMQQKVQFITTVLHDPEILILDEPFSGLDPVNQEVLRETVLDARKAGRTVILSTHNMDQAQELCEGICIIAEGRKILDGQMREVRRSHRANHYRIEFDDPTAEAERFMRGNALFELVGQTRGGWDIELGAGIGTVDLMRAIAEVGLPLKRFEHMEPTLHEIFVQQVGGSALTSRRRQVVNA